VNVLFISSGNAESGICTIIKNQGDSLIEAGINIEYFNIKGKGIVSYIRHIFILRKKKRNKKYDIFHAHYSLSAVTAILAGCKPLIVSLMGSDAYGDYIENNQISFTSRIKILLTYLIQPFVYKIISKSDNIEKYVYLKRKSVIIPNGINLNFFRPNNSRFEVREKFGFRNQIKYVLFVGNTKNKRKNYKLVEESFSLIHSPFFKLINLYPINHIDMPDYLNATDVLILTSFAEGSPNIIKEAMACNCPVVSTAVGDVKWLFGNEPGHFITSFEPENVADKIKMALIFSEERGRTNGRKRINELSLDSETVAKKVIGIYEEVLARH
jgi:teichuronic acid biosynthesis glycosyltransferase TuaC